MSKAAFASINARTKGAVADGGRTWITAPVTLQAKTTIGGLALGATVLFKYRPVTKASDGDWSQPASLVIS
ncbi:MAG: hypothetical protein M3O36_17180 [Myxococcota bacterium]|nr:hypothetical protein [Myxococcota bacterium]